MIRALGSLARGRKRLTLLGAVPVALVSGVAALAYFTSGGTGAGAATVGTLNAPTNVAVSATPGNSTVHVTWTASALGGGAVAPIGYYVNRYLGTTAAVVGGACGTPAAPVNQAACNEHGVANGTYTYTVVAVYRSWTAESGHSPSVTVTDDNVPPTVSAVTITNDVTGAEGVLQQGSGYYVYANAADKVDGSGLASVSANLSGLTTAATAVALTTCSTACTVGSTTYAFKSALQTADASLGEGATAYSVTATDNVALTGSRSGSVTVDNTAPVSSAILAPAANGAGWNNSQPVHVALSASDANAINSITYSKAGAETAAAETYSGPFDVTTPGTTTVSFHARDAAGNVEAPDNTTAVKIDLTAPVTTDNTASIGSSWNSTDQTVLLSVTETGSGGDRTYYTTDGTTPTTASAVYGSGIVLGTTGTYTVKYFSVDVAGNTEAVKTAGTQIRIDKSGPSTPAVTASAATGDTYVASATSVFINAQVGKSGGFQVDATSSDAESGIAKVSFPSLTGFSTGGGDDSTGPYSTTYSWTGAVGASGAQVVTASNGASPALTAGSTFTLTADTTPPSGGVLTVNGTAANGGGSSSYSAGTGFTIGARTDYTDSGSGLASSTLTVQSFSLSSSNGVAAGTCGAATAPFSSPTAVSGTTQPGGIVTGRCYLYTLTGTDNVGNTTSISTIVKVDTSAPSAPSPTLSAATGSSYIDGTTVYTNPQAGKAGGFTVTASPTDSDSGIQSVVFPSLTGFTSGGGTVVSSPYTVTYAWSGSGAIATGAQTVTATSNAALTTNSSFTVTPDTTAPAGAIAASGTSASIALTATVSDGSGAGAASVAYYRCTGTGASCTGTTPLSASASWTLIGASSSPGTWPVAWDSTAAANGSYTLKAVLTDNVGNVASTTGTGTTVIVGNSYAFRVSDPSTPTAIIAGSADPNTITVQLQANGSDTGNLNGAAYTGIHAISFGGTAMAAAPNGTTASPASVSLSFSASGQATVPAGTITFVKAGTGLVLTVQDAANAISGSSTTFSVGTGTAARLAWTNVTSGGTVGSPCLFTCVVTSTGNFGTFTANVAVTDSSGNIVSGLGAGHTVSVTTPTSGAGSGGAFTSPSAGTTVNLTISSTGQAISTATFTFRAQNGNWNTDTLSTQTTGGTSYTAATASVSK